ncbi:hypothetical protein GGX14DRAFT_400407 [Mycena pura]|uniref:Uncharacterized protein n=1 Tax=Mycena pura TaxID=153505 RepID=A0AAD6V5X2_9AGAR|nr:hypothetical protein GGX14DRAFT_400407 [Mycena pura]
MEKDAAESARLQKEAETEAARLQAEKDAAKAARLQQEAEANAAHLQAEKDAAESARLQKEAARLQAEKDAAEIARLKAERDAVEEARLRAMNDSAQEEESQEELRGKKPSLWRTQPGQPELEALRYSADTDLDTPAPAEAAPSAAAVGSGTAPVAWPPKHSPLLAALESLLARAVATTTALQLEGEEIPPYPPTILALARTLCRRVSLTPPTSTPTFASVAATALTTPIDPRSNTSPPATAHHGTRTEPLSPPLAPPRTADPLPAPPKKRQPRRRTRQRSLHCAIYRWLGAPPLSVERPSEADIVEALEGVVSEGSSAPRIHGMSWTPAGHLAIHTRSPFLATQLLPFFPRIDTAIKRHTTRLEGRCVLDVDIPWTWVVLHGVPAKAFWEVMDNEGHGIWTELTSQGYGEEVLKYHPMLKSGRSRDDEDHLSIKLAFTEEGSAKRLLAQSGVFLFGAHCRAVKYRP